MSWYNLSPLLVASVEFLKQLSQANLIISIFHGLDGPGFEPRWERDFSCVSRRAPRPTQRASQWVRGLFPMGKAPGHGVNLPLPSSAEAEEGMALYHTLPLGLHDLLYGEIYISMCQFIIPRDLNIPFQAMKFLTSNIFWSLFDRLGT